MDTGILFVILFCFSLCLINYDNYICVLSPWEFPPLWGNGIALFIFFSLKSIAIYGSILGLAYKYGWGYGLAALLLRILFGWGTALWHQAKQGGIEARLLMEEGLGFNEAQERASQEVARRRYGQYKE